MPARLLAAALRAQSAGMFIAQRAARSGRLKIVFANESFCAMTQHSAAELVGREFDSLHVEPHAVQRVRQWLQQTPVTGTLTGEGYLVRSDGSTLSVAWCFDPLTDPRGRVTHVVATYRDQTNMRRLQEALVHSQRLDAVGRLAGGVAHDFNNLVSVINGYCEILATHVATNPQAMREVAEIHNAGRQAAALTQQLLAFSRRQPLDLRVANLNALIRDNAEILRRLIGDAGRLDLELADDLANIRTDTTQFHQALLNLVLNARDALRDKGRIVVATANREITAKTQRAPTDPAPGRYVALTVTDNGTGMDTETMKHLFEPFFTTKPEGKGTGLGLALVYGVVQQSGGTISVSSELLVGSKFEVLLPAVAAKADEPAAVVAPLPSLRGNENVLFIEPDEIVRKMVAGMLTADGYRVTAVGTFEEVPPDPAGLRTVQLLVTSLRGEGEKLARQIHSQRPDLRLLMIGQHEDEQASAPWLPPERQTRLNKPYALSELLRCARKLLDA